jgi:hypothetical protein
MPEGRALGQARRPGGVEQVGRIVVRRSRRRRVRTRAQRVQHLQRPDGAAAKILVGEGLDVGGGSDQSNGARVARDVRDLRRRQPGVHRHRNERRFVRTVQQAVERTGIAVVEVEAEALT